MDGAYPDCFCEAWSLVGDDFGEVGNGELLARVLTSPGHYANDEILTQKLTAATASGVSLIRQGASDGEILLTIDTLLAMAAEPQTLIGAAIFPVDLVRALDGGARWYGIYHTPDGEKAHHADILATTVVGSGSFRKKEDRARRAKLRDAMMPTIVFSQLPNNLLGELRRHGI
ncbi:hypothetical protein [Brevundimonas sp.]|uniref:hypothetical protein n=1 Tax=Brevundimonas sp. TaxID=1871086 RepID=UPI00286D116B|nr:hypothetical protein [Brevundimonas sp.]